MLDGWVIITMYIKEKLLTSSKMLIDGGFMEQSNAAQNFDKYCFLARRVVYVPQQADAFANESDGLIFSDVNLPKEELENLLCQVTIKAKESSLVLMNHFVSVDGDVYDIRFETFCVDEFKEKFNLTLTVAQLIMDNSEIVSRFYFIER